MCDYQQPPLPVLLSTRAISLTAPAPPPTLPAAFCTSTCDFSQILTVFTNEVTHRSIALAANILWRNSLPRYTKPELHIVNSSQLHSLAEIPKQWTTFYLNSPPAVPSSINVLDKAINSAALTIGFFVHLLRVRLLCTIKLAEAFFETPWLISESELRWSD